MPLVTLTTKAAWHPDTDTAFEHLGPKPKQIVDFGQALPEMARRLSDLDLAPVAVQVSHKLANSHDVHAPDLWIEIRFTEHGLDEEYRTTMVATLKKLIYGFFWQYMSGDSDIPAKNLARFDIACDVHWPNGSHGFLKIGDTELDW